MRTLPPSAPDGHAEQQPTGEAGGGLEEALDDDAEFIDLDEYVVDEQDPWTDELEKRVEADILEEDYVAEVEEKIADEDEGSKSQAGGPAAQAGIPVASGASTDAAASSADVARVPHRISRLDVLRNPAEAKLDFTHGKLVFHTSKANFEAHCPYHNKCVLTRTNRPRQLKDGTWTSQGRPLAMMY
eukprot:6483260-Amphidinium_carterae.1